MHQVIDTYEKWCSRLSTARLNRWLRKVSIKFPLLFLFPNAINAQFGYKTLLVLSVCMFTQVMSRHSWKDQAAQPKIKYFTQVKARPPTFVAFLSGKTQLSDTELRFLTKSLKEDFDLGGIPIRIMQRSVPKRGGSSGNRSSQQPGKMVERTFFDKRTIPV